MRKVLEELKNPWQFFRPNRTRDLLQKGHSAFRSAFTSVELNSRVLEEKMKRELACIKADEHTLVFNSEAMHLMGILFEDIQLKYELDSTIPERSGYEYSYNQLASRVIAVVPTTTYRLFDMGTEKAHRLPSEGYKDWLGNSVPFQKREKGDQVQHGGVLFTDNLSNMNILNYTELEKIKTKSLSQGEVVIEANWYMDSENFEKVSSRKNLLERRGYNCFGFFFYEDGSMKFFLINNGMDRSFFEIENALSNNPKEQAKLKQPKNILPNVAEIATLCNIMMKATGATGWKLCGGEFFGGGLYFHPDEEFSMIKDGIIVYRN